MVWNTGEVAMLNEAVLEEAPARWAAMVVRLLDEQGELCTRLESLAQEQSTLVEEGWPEELLGVLSDRQRVVDRVLEINGALTPFRARRETLLARLGPVDRAGIQGRIDTISAALERVRESDERDRRELERRRTAVADELSALARGRGAVSAYGSGTAGLKTSPGDGLAGSRLREQHG